MIDKNSLLNGQRPFLRRIYTESLDMNINLSWMLTKEDEVLEIKSGAVDAENQNIRESSSSSTS